MDPSFKGKPQPVAEAVDFGQSNLHANNLQEQLRLVMRRFSAVCDFSQMRESGVLNGGFLPIFHHESSRFEITYLNISKLS
jgi:hypothetical protein